MMDVLKFGTPPDNFGVPYGNYMILRREKIFNSYLHLLHGIFIFLNDPESISKSSLEIILGSILRHIRF